MDNIDRLEQSIDTLLEEKKKITSDLHVEQAKNELQRQEIEQLKEKIEILEKVEIPASIKDITPGFYWAKTDVKFNWFNLIVQVWDESPFMRYRMWDRVNDIILNDYDINSPSYSRTDKLINNIVWGPKIINPSKGEK